MPRNSSQPTGIDRLAALLEPAFPLRMLGFGLIYAWSTCLWDIPLADPLGGALLQEEAPWTFSAALTPVACIAVSLVGRRRELSDFRWLYVAGPLLTSVGTLAALVYPILSGAPQFLAFAVAGIGTGAGPVVLIVLWTCLFARTETGIVETVVPASFVATLVCALVVPNFPGGVAATVVTALPLASGAFLLLSKHALDGGAISHETTDASPEASPIHRGSIARMFLIIFAVYGLGCALPAATRIDVGSALDTAATIAGMLFAVALSASLVLFSRRINLDALFRWISAPFVFAIIFTALETASATVVSRILMNVVFTGIEIIMVLYFIRLARKTGRNSTFFVGIGECAAYAGVFAGYMAQPPLHSLIEQGAVDAQTLCLFLVGAFVVATLFVPRRDLTWDAQPTAMTAAQSGAAEQSANEARLTSLDAAQAIALRRSATARAHGLSNRETEIFLLLAQGRSRPYIRDTLVLSKNTVATHIRHIYEKLDIHSQQELIDLVENERSDRP